MAIDIQETSDRESNINYVNALERRIMGDVVQPLLGRGTPSADQKAAIAVAVDQFCERTKADLVNRDIFPDVESVQGRFHSEIIPNL